MSHQAAILAGSAQTLLLAPRFSGQELSTASGFVVRCSSGPLLITARHVVTGRHQETGAPLARSAGIPNELVVWHHHQQLGTWIEKVEPLQNEDGTPLWVEHPTFGARVDVIALRLTEINDTHLFPHELPPVEGIAPSLGPAESVSVVGFPFGRRYAGSLAIWATGFVATEPAVDFDELPLFLVDCRSREGQSGAPVLLQRTSGPVTMNNGATMFFDRPISRLLGVYSGRINAESDLGFVWKLSVVRELVSACGG